MAWRLSFSSDGSFCEELTSPQTSYSSGYHAAAAAGGCEPGSSSNGSSSSIETSGGSDRGSGSWGGSNSRGGNAYCCTPGVCWGSDDAGCPRRLQLDDEESLLLSTWVRAGMWVLPSVAELLSIREVPPPACSRFAAGSEEEAGKVQPRCQGETGAAGASVWLELRLKQGGRVRCCHPRQPAGQLRSHLAVF